MKEPFQRACVAGVPFGQLNCVFDPVPAGQLLVIETVTAGLTMTTGTSPASMALETQAYNLIAEHVLVPTPGKTGINTVNGVKDQFSLNHDVHIYAEPGTSVTISMVPGEAAAADIYATISGYLVACPAGPACSLP